MNEQPQAGRQQRSTGAILLEFFGSMNLAITLLVALAIASVIGTVLQQNQPYNDYVRKFGPFWFDVFKSLGFYDIYSASWFLILLGFLLLSTAVCVWRNTPAILREVRHFRLDVQEKSLRAFHHVTEWPIAGGAAGVAGKLETLLKARGYRVRSKVEGESTTIAATKGGLGRLGYIVFHLSIIIICVGGLINGNLPLRFDELLGKVKVETRDLPVSQIPPESILSTKNLAFRGDVRIPEGYQVDYIFLQVRDGYLVQKLPFKVKLDQFRIEHYPTGQPKSFESDVTITADDLKEPLHKTVKVNHPLDYKGYKIYQASFSDGGSRLSLKAWPLDVAGSEPAPLDIKSAVHENVPINTPRGTFTLEFSDFRMFNIFPSQDPKASGKEFQNYGPSVIFKLRNAAGEAREYVNYMAPLMEDGRPFMLSGMRTLEDQDYRYLHIPVDSQGGIGRFVRLRAKALDSNLVRSVAESQTLAGMGMDKVRNKQMAQQLVESVVNLVHMFVADGIDAVVAHTEKNIEPAKRNDALESYIKVVQSVLGELYVQQLREDGVDLSNGVSKEDARYFDDAVNAMSLIGPYGSPIYLQLADFKQVQASGLQITRTPGTPTFLLGSMMLMVGVFIMLYIHNRRVWLRITTTDEGTNLLLAGTSHRNRGDFDQEFEALTQTLRQATTKPD